MTRFVELIPRPQNQIFSSQPSTRITKRRDKILEADDTHPTQKYPLGGPSSLASHRFLVRSLGHVFQPVVRSPFAHLGIVRVDYNPSAQTVRGNCLQLLRWPSDIIPKHPVFPSLRPSLGICFPAAPRPHAMSTPEDHHPVVTSNLDDRASKSASVQGSMQIFVEGETEPVVTRKELWSYYCIGLPNRSQLFGELKQSF